MNRTTPESQVVFVTGASSGIGAATATALARAGARVVLCARRAEAIADVRAQLYHPEAHLALVLDVTDQAAVQTAVHTAYEHYGQIDVLVCCAGVGLSGPVASLDEALLWQTFNTNVNGVLHPIQAVLPHFRLRGGHIVVVTSVVAEHALPYNGGYAATKAALERLCEALRIELRADNIPVTVIRPGTVRTAFFAHRLGVPGERRLGTAPAMSPEHVAATIVAALRSHARVIYPRWRDWLLCRVADVFPQLSDRVLAARITWQHPIPDVSAERE